MTDEKQYKLVRHVLVAGVIALAWFVLSYALQLAPAAADDTMASNLPVPEWLNGACDITIFPTCYLIGLDGPPPGMS